MYRHLKLNHELGKIVNLYSSYTAPRFHIQSSQKYPKIDWATRQLSKPFIFFTQLFIFMKNEGVKVK